MNKNYDKQHFINKFEAIPDELWQTESYGKEEKHCALGHCFIDNKPSEESRALWFMANLSIIVVNDGNDPWYQQSTPKARVLAALRDLK